MKVRILTCSVGHGFVRNVGDEIDLPDAEAGRLIAGGIAERIDDAPTKPAKRGRRGKRRVADDPSAVAPETTDNPEA